MGQGSAFCGVILRDDNFLINHEDTKNTKFLGMIFFNLDTLRVESFAHCHPVSWATSRIARKRGVGRIHIGGCFALIHKPHCLSYLIFIS